MKQEEHNIFYADYMDFSIAKNEWNISSPFEQLSFDLLCFYPSSIVLTLTSALIGESSNILRDFHEFWKSGALKIQLSNGDTADTYLRRKLISLNESSDDNYEFKIYTSNGTDAFVNEFLKEGLLKNNYNYVFTRISNADLNNRNAFLNNLVRHERKIIEYPYCPMDIKSFDKFALLIETLAYDQTFTFQRSQIVRELVNHKIFKNNSFIPPIILSIFDLSYNEAMSQSIGAPMLSTIDTQLTGVGLRNFIKGYSPKLYKLIKSLSPPQLFLLAEDKNWRIYKDYISKLYITLFENYHIDQNNVFYKKTLLYESKNNIINFCLEKMMDVVFDAIKQIDPMAYFNLYQMKLNLMNIAKNFLIVNGKEGEYYSEEIIKRTKMIEQLCEDILKRRYI